MGGDGGEGGPKGLYPVHPHPDPHPSKGGGNWWDISHILGWYLYNFLGRTLKCVSTLPFTPFPNGSAQGLRANSIFFDFISEHSFTDTKTFGCPCLNPLVFVKGLEDEGPFDLFQRLGQILRFSC